MRGQPDSQAPRGAGYLRAQLVASTITCTMRLDGIHHISAITGDARGNVDFYTRVLGLRMIAKTVNQDDPSVYHLFYGDEHARPGADLTFFEYPGAKPGRAGAGMVHTVVWRVGSAAALDFWEQRLAAEGIAAERGETRCASPTPRASATSSSVAATDDPPLIAEHPEVPAEHALQGFEGVRAYTAHAEGSALVLEKLMNATRTARRHVRAARRPPRRLDPLRPRPRGARAAERRHRPPHRLGHDGRRAARLDRPPRTRSRSRTAATSTATTSTRSTSASPAGSSTSSPPRSPASPSTARRRSSAGR